ncbi:MAG: hypothetical protein CL503_00820 [Actinobacteria bacterium]|nr:hypothetical protein [Actinomycetota bacterium]
MSIQIITKRVSHFEQNARLIIDTNTNQSMLVDPGADAEILFNLLGDSTLTTIFLTHCHIDHAGGVQALLSLIEHHKLPKPTLLYHSNEIIIGEHIDVFATQYGFSAADYQNPPKPDQLADDLTELTLGSSTFKILFTPGHAPGHLALYYDQDDFSLSGDYPETLHCNRLLIAGDTLFQGSIGRTDLPMANHDQLIDSIKTQLLTLPETTLVCPGHGANTTIATESQTNPFLH